MKFHHDHPVTLHATNADINTPTLIDDKHNGADKAELENIPHLTNLLMSNTLEGQGERFHSVIATVLVSTIHFTPLASYLPLLRERES